MNTLNKEMFKLPYLNLGVCNARPRFIMLVGVPGSGKTTLAEFLGGNDTVHLSSDTIREELWGDANCQKDHAKVFELMHKRTLEALNAGYDVIYDATNITRKSRRAILGQLPANVIKECNIVWAPIEVCIKRDAARARTVGKEVIDSMLKRFEAPFYDEGFDFIRVKVSVHGCEFDPYKYYYDSVSALCIPHDNPHHSADVYEHCMLCGDYLKDKDIPQIVKTAGYIHDIGKPYTKVFTNAKGEPTETAHYYGHHSVGAWISYGFICHDITLAWLISTHMAPFINQKYYNSLNPLYKKWIDVLHEADLAAH